MQIKNPRRTCSERRGSREANASVVVPGLRPGTDNVSVVTFKLFRQDFQFADEERAVAAVAETVVAVGHADVVRPGIELDLGSARSLYQSQIPFRKGTGEFSGPQVGTVLKGKLADNPEEKLMFTLGSSPAHGTVTIDTDGSFIYYPDKDFKGEDTFSFRYSELLEYSEPCTVTINVN